MSGRPGRPGVSVREVFEVVSEAGRISREGGSDEARAALAARKAALVARIEAGHPEGA